MWITVYYYPFSCCSLRWLALTVNVIQLMHSNAGGKRGHTTKRLKEVLGVMDLLIIIVRVLISWVYTYVKTYQLMYLHMCSLLCVHNTSVKILHKKIKYRLMSWNFKKKKNQRPPRTTVPWLKLPGNS